MKNLFVAVALTLSSASVWAAGQQVTVVTLDAYSDSFSVHFKEAGFGTPQFFNAGICPDVPQIVQSAILVILADARKTKEIIGVSVKGNGDGRCVNAAFQQAI